MHGRHRAGKTAGTLARVGGARPSDTSPFNAVTAKRFLRCGPGGTLDTEVLTRQVNRPLKEPGPWRNPSSVANASATVVARDFTISTRTRSFARNAIPSWSLPR
jgi:hypothetical protein